MDSIGITTGGKQYKIGDTLVFDNSKSGGQNVSAKVTSIGGKSISQIRFSNLTTIHLLRIVAVMPVTIFPEHISGI